MSKPLNEFGGWLRFFWAVCWVSQVASGVAAPMILWFLVSEKGLPLILENLSLLGDLGTRFYLVGLILKVIQVPRAASAERIRGLLKIVFAVAVGFLAFDLGLALWKNGWAWTKDAERALREGKSGVAWPGVWLAYFLNSKRVKAFYTQPEPAASPLEPR